MENAKVEKNMNRNAQYDNKAIEKHMYIFGKEDCVMWKSTGI